MQVTKLRQILPGSIDRFHDALDHLEESLASRRSIYSIILYTCSDQYQQTAKLVMRRDLALCRERAGISKPAQINGTETKQNTEKPRDLAKTEVNVGEEPEKEAPLQAPSEDVAMQDTQLDQAFQADKSASEASVESKDSLNPLKEESESDEPPADCKPQVDDSQMDQKPSDSALQIDTQTRPKHENGEADDANEDRPPDTGTYTNDFESLFGGPTSAGPVDAPEFGIDPNNNAEFDFGPFDNNGADNDNISALLPGLQDYANNQATESGEPGFGALFATDLPMSNNGQDDGQLASNEHRDSTFDDLMDFADFNPADYAEGSGEGGTNENQEFDFSFE